jgi:hypothetical protein
MKGLSIFIWTLAAGVAVFFFTSWYGKRTASSTGSNATALHPRPVQASNAQGSGSLQANEAISYGQVPLQYAKSTVPNAKNVGKPIHQHTNFIVPTTQRVHPIRKPKVRSK